jgi:hypothetical protein
MKLDPDSQNALERLRGRPGGSKASDSAPARRSPCGGFNVGSRGPVKSTEDKNVCAVTIEGWRYLEAQRQAADGDKAKGSAA